MKLFFFFLLWISSLTLFSQVGINTDNPQTTLDVNGTFRVRELTSPSIQAVYILGIDNNGNFREITVGQNIQLKDNELVAVNRTLETGTISQFNTGQQINNLNLLTWPGEANEGKMIIRMDNVQGDMEITGIVGGLDGMHVWLYAVSGKLKLIPNSTNSDFGNRIEENDKMGAKQYGMIELFYDGVRNKWIVMQNHD